VAPELKLSASDLQGVLRGTSRNASTTCTPQKSTGGPEAFYLLRLSERTLVDLEVISDLDSVLAIRSSCDDPLTEVACSDGPGASDGQMKLDAVDARVPPPQTGRDAHLRASLPAGTYYVLIDEAEPFGFGGDFQLRVRTSTPPAQITCAAAPTVSAGTRLLAEELDLASEQPPCGGESARPALFYRAAIPAGARLTARAVPTSGDRFWTPALQLFTSCASGGANLCLASDQAALEGQRELRYLNDGPTEQTVLLSVSDSEPVTGAMFRLEVNIAERNLSCASAQPLSDGLVLLRQDFSDAPTQDLTSSCSSGAPALFYSARLYPGQYVRLWVSPTGGPSLIFPVTFATRERCDSVSCQGGDVNEIYYTNLLAEPRTVIIEAYSAAATEVTPFDLHVEMPRPLGRILVRADRGLTTTEGGGQASFQVALTSPSTEMVEIPLASGDPEEGQVSPPVLRFSPTDWDRPQTVTVTGVDDSKRDGTRPYTVKVGPSTSADPRYQGVEGNTVALVNRDDEPGFHIESPAALVTSERGTTATFRVFLDRAPTATVHLPLSSSDETEGKVTSSELVFEPASWRDPQTVTVLGLDDDETDGSRPYQVVLGAASSDDPQYQGIDPADLPALNDDDDLQPVAPTVVNGSMRCYLTSDKSLAVDQAGVLYASMVCPTQDPASLPPDEIPPYLQTVWVAASADGGRTFGAPVDTRLPANTAAIAAGRPGLVVAMAASPGRVAIARSEDGGVSWQPPQLVDTPPPNGIPLVYLAAAGERVLMEEGGVHWWISEDGARTLSPLEGPGSPQAVGLDPDGTIWAVLSDREWLRFRSSRDGGATFQSGAWLPLWYGGFAAGSSMLYVGLSGFSRVGLLAVPRDGLSMSKVVDISAMSDRYTYHVAVDHEDNVTVGLLVEEQIQLYRLAAGDSAVGPARVVGRVDGSSSLLALSDRAVAVLFSSQGKISVAVETWP
jgi:hypothetical protein